MPKKDWGEFVAMIDIQPTTIKRHEEVTGSTIDRYPGIDCGSAKIIVRSVEYVPALIAAMYKVREHVQKLIKLRETNPQRGRMPNTNDVDHVIAQLEAIGEDSEANESGEIRPILTVPLPSKPAVPGNQHPAYAKLTDSIIKVADNLDDAATNLRIAQKHLADYHLAKLKDELSPIDTKAIDTAEKAAKALLNYIEHFRNFNGGLTTVA